MLSNNIIHSRIENQWPNSTQSLRTVDSNCTMSKYITNYENNDKLTKNYGENHEIMYIQDDDENGTAFTFTFMKIF